MPDLRRNVALPDLRSAVRKFPRAALPGSGSGRGNRGRTAIATKELVGLKVGASQLAAATVINNGAPKLVQLARAPLRRGVVVGGELREPEALAPALQDFFSAHGFPRDGVRLGIASNRIGVRTIELSGVDDPKQLDNAVRFRAQEVLPVPLEHSVLDYHVLSEDIGEDGSVTRRIQLVVAYRDLIDRYVGACRAAGIKLVGIDLEAFALLRALAPPPSTTEESAVALVAVALGHDRSTCAVANASVCEFTRVLEFGGAALTSAVARALDVPPPEAELVKHGLSLDPTAAAPAELSFEQVERARDAIRRQLDGFARELVSSLHFYQNQADSLPIGEVVITGGTAGLPGLADELARLIGVPVRVGDPLARVRVADGLEPGRECGSHTIAIGLGIED